MSDLIEAVFTSDANGSQWTCCAWDPRTGTNVMMYKGGGAAAENSLVLVRHEYLITANNTKPMLHIWPLNSQDQVSGTRFITPGKVLSLDVSPDGNYLVAGIQEVVHIWHLCSGKMITALSKHYQAVTKIKFTDDGSHFLSAGQDGNIVVWNLTKAISTNQKEAQPLYTLSGHGLSVTDFHVGAGGVRALLYTVSLDRTCRVYDLSTGNLLLDIVFPEAMQRIVVNKSETVAYLGSVSGRIYEVNLCSPPRSREYHIGIEESKNSFTGHNGSVTCLALSVDGELLISGGVDENVNIWHTPSRQLIRTLPHKGKISNVAFTCVTRRLKEPLEAKHKPSFVVTGNLKRMVDVEDDNYVVETIVNEAIEVTSARPKRPAVVTSTGTATTDSSNEIEKLRAQINELQKVNKELFNFCAKQSLLRE
ncbi:unnamed protein product [Hermetia illucens]|uniref:WD repeat-containing protein 18 n=1 Tax=Hermetia illucens TaxID=343691 RepID=A0A7R8V052_HERIL|nr:WD repeat-containing protein 18 [Hermetia illucens]CAD7089774.1 unnamed protein product [Hermetia illucens]